MLLSWALSWPGAGAAQEPGSDTLRLGLGDAVRLAVRQNAAVQVAEYGSEEASARVTQERSDLLPQVSALLQQAGRSFNTATFGLELPGFDPNGEVIGPVKTVDVRGRLEQKLFDWSAIQRVRSASANLTASRAETESARERIAGTAANAYVQALRARGRERATEQDVELARQLVSVAQQMLDAGVGVRLDLTRAQAQLAAMNAQLIASRTAAAHGRLALLRAMNLPLDTPLVLSDTLEAVARPELPSAESAVGVAYEKRADLAVLESRIRAQERQASAIRAERLPTLSFVGDEGWIGPRYGNLLNTYDWGLEVSVPVFNGLDREGRLQEQRARVSALEVQRRDLREEVSLQVRSALLDLRSAAEQVTATRARLDLAEAEWAQAQERFRAGVAGSADVTTASLRLSEARSAYVDVLAAYQAAAVALRAAEGTASDLP